MQQPYFIYFRFLGFPVTIHPFFWLIAVLIGMPHQINNMADALIRVAVWVAAVFIAIMVHELGHALVFRYVFHVNASITLHGMGGYAAPSHPPHRKRGWRGFWSFILLYSAGVGSGFVLAALAYLILNVIPPLTAENNVVVMRISDWLEFIIGIGVVWGIFNLLPVFPFDGGQIAREVCCAVMPRRGHRVSLYLSMTCAMVLAMLAVQYRQFFLTIIFGYFAYRNYQELL